MDQTNCLENSNDCSFRKLSRKEEALKKALSEIKGETIIALSIRKRLAGGSIRGFREMINELKEQYRDCGRERMITVLGIDAVRLLEVI